MVFRVMVLMISGFLCPHLVDAQRAIPDDNLAYPVLITLTNCISNLTMVQGSGFFLETATEVYLVTARHVLFNESERVQPPQAKHVQCKMAELLSYSNDPKDKQQNRIAVNLQALDDARKIKAHATHDVASVQIGIVRAPGTGTLPTVPPNPIGQVKENSVGFIAGVQLIQSAPTLLGVSLDTVKKFDEVLTANDIYVFGYPSSNFYKSLP
jgi:hypothetical protein